ncbi:MAG TPA: tetratricopeptide repeat protein, partial [Terriglobales bacterium]|nr:tetratricopeptide repeat protein [Terriglobales bacterium]
AARLRSLSDDEILLDRLELCLRCAKQSIEFGDANTGELFYRQILALVPDHHAALAGLGKVALHTGHVADAVGLLRRACMIAPDQMDYRVSLAQALHAAGRLDDAFDVLRLSLQTDGQNKDLLGLAVVVASGLERNEEAANYCARLLRLEPDNKEARLHLARMQAVAGDFDQSEQNFQRVRALDPDDPVASFSLGCLALRREDLQNGWKGFARRFDAGLTRPQPMLDLPALAFTQETMPDLSAERIAVRPEPGLKDQILFSRWLTRLRRDCDFLVGELDPRLIPLIDQTQARLSLFPAGSLQVEEVRDLDITSQISLGDLGGRYGRDITSLGAPVPYLRFDQAKAVMMRQQYLNALGASRLIGLCWRGGTMSIPLAEWLPVLHTQDFGFVALQAGPAHQELHDVFDSIGKTAVRDPAIDPQTNLRGFAAQIAAMDLVISVDEVPAHLAGALGVPTLCLLPKVADWRWFDEGRQDSPWYPTMRLYRQPTDGAWLPIMAAISTELDVLVAGDRQEGRDE